MFPSSRALLWQGPTLYHALGLPKVNRFPPLIHTGPAQPRNNPDPQNLPFQPSFIPHPGKYASSSAPYPTPTPITQFLFSALNQSPSFLLSAWVLDYALKSGTTIVSENRPRPWTILFLPQFRKGNMSLKNRHSAYRSEVVGIGDRVRMYLLVMGKIATVGKLRCWTTPKL